MLNEICNGAIGIMPLSKLPPKYELKLNRLLTALGLDSEELMISAIDTLWEKYGAEVRRFERQQKRHSQIVAETEKRLKNLKTKKVKAQASRAILLVGSFNRRIDVNGYLTLPKEWMSADGGWIFANGQTGEMKWVMNSEAFALMKDSSDFIPVVVDERRRIKFDLHIMKNAGLSRDVVLEGRLRYAVIRNRV